MIIIIILSSRDFLKKILILCLPVFSIVYKVLDELGGYSAPNSPTTTDLTHLIRRILQIYSSPLFDVYLDRSLLDPNETLSIYVDLPKRFVPSRHFLETKVSDLGRALFSKNNSLGNISQNHDNDTKSKSITPFRFCVRAAHAYKREMVHYELLKGYRSVS